MELINDYFLITGMVNFKIIFFQATFKTYNVSFKII